VIVLLKKKIENNIGIMSAGQKKVAKYIFEKPLEASFLTASEIGNRAGVSESTVIRLASALGYNGFPQLKTAIQHHVMEHLSTIERHKDYEKDHEENFLERIIDSASTTLSLTKVQVQREAIKNLASKIINAPSVFIVGNKSSYALAYYLSYYLSWFMSGINLLDSHMAYESIVSADKKTLVVGISFPRFSRWTVNVLSHARNEGLSTAAITNDFSSPLAEVSDSVLSVPWNPVSFIDSFTAPLCVINALLLTITHDMGTQTDDQLEKLEIMWKEQKIYT